MFCTSTFLKTEEYEGGESPYKQSYLIFINIYYEFLGIFIYGRDGIQEGKSALGIGTFLPHFSKLIGKLQILVWVQFISSDMHAYASNKI